MVYTPLKITWDESEGKVIINPSFWQLYDIARLDCIKDAIFELEQLYLQEYVKTFNCRKCKK
jgi:hypothetical protein